MEICMPTGRLYSKPRHAHSRVPRYTGALVRKSCSSHATRAYVRAWVQCMLQSVECVLRGVLVNALEQREGTLSVPELGLRSRAC
jgi:hypothetical protein